MSISRQPQVGDYVKIEYLGVEFLTKITKIDGLTLHLFDEKNNNPNVILVWTGLPNGWMLSGNIKPTSVSFIFPETLPAVTSNSSTSSSYAPPPSPSTAVQNYFQLSLINPPPSTTKIVKFFSGKHPFSNFFELKRPIVYNSLTFPTSEHLYQWAKFNYPSATPVTLFYAEFVRNASTPNKSKIIANQKLEPERYPWIKEVNNIIRNGLANGVQMNPNWENVKIDVMRTVLALKFADPELKQMLLDTSDALIQENSPYDNFYGIGKDGSGQNMLGKLLMELRDKLRKT